jgi:hypothetical protein
MRDDTQPASVLDRRYGEQPTEEIISAAVEEGLMQDIEEYKERRGISRSQAVRELLSGGLEDDTWSQKRREVKNILDDPELVGFSIAAVRNDGDGHVRLQSRGGLDEGLPLDVTPDVEPLLISLLMQLDAYADMADTDIESLMVALQQLHAALETGEGMRSFDLGGES